MQAVVDYARPAFLGLRTPDGLYCFFGRNLFGGTVGFSAHRFADGVDEQETTNAWQAWLDRVFAWPA